MKRKVVKKFVEPNSAKAFGVVDHDDGLLKAFAEPDGVFLSGHVPVRIIRERDYQRLLKLVEQAKRVKK